MRSLANIAHLTGLTLALASCVTGSVPPDEPRSADAVIASAQLLLGAGANGALLAVSDASSVRLASRLSEANVLVDALEGYMLALRAAFPTSSEVVPGSVSLALLPREAAEHAWSNAMREPDWSRQYPALALTQARDFLDAAERLLEASAAPGERLSLAWLATADAYAAWCLAVAKLSERTDADRVATWLAD